MTKSILICTDYLPPSDGGVETVVDHLSRGLVARNWNVHIFTLGFNGHYETDGGPVEIHSANALNLTPLIGLQSQISYHAFFRFRNIVNEIQPDLIHAHNRFFFTSLVALSWKKVSKQDIPLVTTLHLGDTKDIDGIGGFAARAYERSIGQQIVRNSDWIIAVSNAVSQIGIKLGADPQRVSVIRNAVDAETFTPSGQKDEKSVLYVGRLIRNNGPHILLKAVPEILASHPDAEIHLIGSGSMQAKLKNQINDKDLGKSVMLHGFVDDTVPYFQRATVFCRPSFSEGLPLTLLEAMATATPPVVTDVAGVPEVVTHGETGLLLPPGDPSAVATAVTKLLTDTIYRKEMGKTAREYILTNHTWEDRTNSVIEVYQTLLNMGEM